jgi:hypothetical protein
LKIRRRVAAAGKFRPNGAATIKEGQKKQEERQQIPFDIVSGVAEERLI